MLSSTSTSGKPCARPFLPAALYCDVADPAGCARASVRRSSAQLATTGCNCARLAHPSAFVWFLHERRHLICACWKFDDYLKCHNFFLLFWLMLIGAKGYKKFNCDANFLTHFLIRTKTIKIEVYTKKILFNILKKHIWRFKLVLTGLK